MTRFTSVLLALCVSLSTSVALADVSGLNSKAMEELRTAGVDKYLGTSQWVDSEHDSAWTRHDFDPNYVLDETYPFGLRPDGPVCIAGSPYSVLTRQGDPKKLLIFLQGGGACWQDFYFCNILSEAQEPPAPPVGIWSESSEFNTGPLQSPLADYSIVYLPYCDGSVFTGDSDVIDPSFPFGPVRFHRGLENASAGVDMAKAMFPDAKNIVVSGSSAGGVGAASFTPLLVRMAYGDTQRLSVINDAGPVAINLNEEASIAARANDWQFGQYYPASCTDCDAFGQQTALIKWRLDNDNTIREAFYSTDGDATDRFFLNVPTQEMYRDLIVSEHGPINAAHPQRYKVFIRSGDDSHTALQDPILYYYGTANGVPLFEWIEDMLRPGTRAYREKGKGNGPKKNSWTNIVEDFVPVPVP
jgi:hypothetical protein